MRRRDSFSSYHPMIQFFYFALVLFFSMCLMHPLCLIISLGSSVAYALHLNGKSGLLASLPYMLPMMLFAGIINPAFNHRGVTILGYLPSGNPLTLESVLYGIAAAVMLAAALEWFVCYTAVMTSDRFVYLFGRIIPALSLVLTLALRFVPRFIDRWKEVREAQSCIGRNLSGRTVMQRIRSNGTVFSAMVTWALENAIETADSMRSRGYGLPGRSAFSIFRFEERDRFAAVWLAGCGGYILSGWIAGAFSWNYFPALSGTPVTAFTVTFPLAYLALCLMPLILDRWEDRTWKHLRSEI